MKLTHVLESEQAESKVALGKKWIIEHPNASEKEFKEYALTIGFTHTTSGMFYQSQKRAVKVEKLHKPTVKASDDKAHQDLKEHDGETLATTLERGKNKLNAWYAGFYDGFHGHDESSEDDDQYKKGYRKGKSVASQKMYG